MCRRITLFRKSLGRGVKIRWAFRILFFYPCSVVEFFCGRNQPHRQPDIVQFRCGVGTITDGSVHCEGHRARWVGCVRLVVTSPPEIEPPVPPSPHGVFQNVVGIPAIVSLENTWPIGRDASSFRWGVLVLFLCGGKLFNIYIKSRGG